MSFRTKLLLVVLFTIFASVSVVAYGVTYYTRSAFEEMDTQRTEALVAQFKKEFAQRGDEISRQVENIANAEITLRTALDAERPNADLSIYVHDANGAAQDHGLDFVELGLIYGVQVDDGHVHVTFTLTTPGCPIGPQVTEQIDEFVGEVDGVKSVESEMVFTPPWSPERMSEDAKFALGF